MWIEAAIGVLSIGCILGAVICAIAEIIAGWVPPQQGDL